MENKNLIYPAIVDARLAANRELVESINQSASKAVQDSYDAACVSAWDVVQNYLNTHY